MSIFATLVIIAFCFRNYRYTYIPPNDEIPRYVTRVSNPLRLDVSVQLQCFGYYFVLGRQTYSYDLIQDVTIVPKWYSHRPEICIDRYENGIDTHRYLFFLGEDYERIQQELLAGKNRMLEVEHVFTEY